MRIVSLLIGCILMRANKFWIRVIGEDWEGLEEGSHNQNIPNGKKKSVFNKKLREEGDWLPVSILDSYHPRCVQALSVI